LKIRALLIPHTHLRLDLAELLLAAFDQIILLQPTEAKPKGAFQELVERKLVDISTPPPLGEKLVWFERLISSYEEWGQMMRWPENVAMFRSRPEVLEETVSDIKAAILGGPQKREDPDLKARIILQLAQNLDQRLEELDSEYEDLKRHARRLSDFILGQDPTIRRFEKWVIEGQEPPWQLTNLEERLLAFARLLKLIGKVPTENLVTDQWDVVETFLDLAPKAQKLGKINLIPISEGENNQNKEKILKVLDGKEPVEETTPPLLEIWQLPMAPLDLFEAILGTRLPEKQGTTRVFYLRHA